MPQKDERSDLDIWNLAVRMGIALTNAPSYGGKATRQNQDLAVRLRESLRFRSSAVRFHLTQLPGLVEAHRQGLKPRDGFDIHPQSLFDASYEAQYLFDDIVFNLISCFDYLANSVWLGFQGSNHWKRKWRSLELAARKPDWEESKCGTIRFSGSQTAEEVRSAHLQLVDRLSEYRASLIHYAKDHTGATGEIALGDGPGLSYGLVVHPPRAFHEEFSIVLDLGSLEDSSIEEAARQLVQAAFDHMARIIQALIAEVDPEDRPIQIML